jgi:hypothetical protein
MPLLNFPPQTILILIVALGVLILTLWYHARIRAGWTPFRRPLPALDLLWAALGRGAETGRAIHVSPGAGTIGNRATTAETVVGLLAVERVASEAAFNGAHILASSGDAVSHLALRGAIRQSYQQAGQGQDYHPGNVQLLAHDDSMAYAAGVAAIYARQQLEASQLLGSFGQEFLLLGEEGAMREVPQVMGSTSSAALPVMFLSSRSVLIGEEVFAAEAYLATIPAPQSRLLTQDFLRTLIILLIIGGLLYSLLQPTLGLPPLPGLL